jgi:hypothetical protein
MTGRDVGRYQFVPAVLHNFVATPLGGDAATAAAAHWNGLRACTNLAP